MSSSVIRLKHWSYEPSSGRLSGLDGVTELTGLTARVLDVLIAHAPQTVPLETFAKEAWRQSHLSEDTLAQRIAQLRKALGDHPRNPDFIRTIRGEGYALVAPVEALLSGTEARDARTAPPRLPLAMLAMGGVLLLATAGLGASLIVNAQGEPQTVGIAAAGPVSPVDAILNRAGLMIALQDEEGARQAIALLTDALALSPQDARVEIALAVALSTRATKYGGDRIEEAEALARSALAREPDNAAAWGALGYTLDAQSRIDEALAAYGQSLVYEPDNGATLSSMAYLLSVHGRLYEALQLDARALDLGRGGLYTELQVARVMRLLGDDERARRFEARAALLNPEHPVVLAGLAQAALARGETETAHDLLTRLPANRRTGAIHQLLGRLALLQGDRARAVQLFETAGAAALSERIALGLETDSPEDAGQWPEQHVGLAELASAEGDLDRAIQALNTAVALGWRDEDALRRSPFLGPVLETGRTEPVFERIRQQIAAQAERLDRDEVLTQTLDASLNIQP